MTLILIIQNVITISVNLLDNIMLGGYSEVSLSGVDAANQIQFVYQDMHMALGEGLVVLGRQYYGDGQIERQNVVPPDYWCNDDKSGVSITKIPLLIYKVTFPITKPHLPFQFSIQKSFSICIIC